MQGREYVERVFNCEDLLMNYVMAQKLNGGFGSGVEALGLGVG